jgi:hypothetical protein
MGSLSDDEDETFFEDVDREDLTHNAAEYRPQKEFLFNKHLPYAEHIDEEAEAALARIKANFARAVLLSEPRPGLLTYCLRLQKYV